MRDLTLQNFQNLVPLDREVSGRGLLYSAQYGGLDVMLKVMAVAPETARQAFEALSARTNRLIELNHPGIVRHIGCFQHKGSRGLQHVVVTERLQGETLKERLAREAAGIGTIESLRMAKACLDTLCDLAAVSLLHRDLTPSNIFIVSGGAHPEYKLIDFGVETFEPPVPEDATSTMPVPVKQDYVAPELIGADQPTERSDLYTFAMTLHEVLTGKLAFKRSSFKQDGIGEPLSCVNWLVLGLGILLERCFAQNAEERLATFAEFFCRGVRASADGAGGHGRAFVPSPPFRRRGRFRQGVQGGGAERGGARGDAGCARGGQAPDEDRLREPLRARGADAPAVQRFAHRPVCGLLPSAAGTFG